MPFAFKSSGILAGCLIMLIVCIICTNCAYILVISKFYVIDFFKMVLRNLRDDRRQLLFLSDAKLTASIIGTYNYNRLNSNIST